jgi:hypothetical protein
MMTSCGLEMLCLEKKNSELGIFDANKRYIDLWETEPVIQKHNFT